MRRLMTLSLMAVLTLTVCSCGNTTTKQFKEVEAEVQSIESQINEITNCDELQMMNFGILGLRSDMDNYRIDSEMTETEISKLDEMIDQLEAAWNGKWASLDCEQQMGGDELDTSGEEAGDYDYNTL